MVKKFNFGKAAHFFEGGNNSATAEKTQEEVAAQAAKRAKRIKVIKYTAAGVATVAVGVVTVRGIKKLINKKKEQGVPAPAEEEQPATEQPTAEEQQPAEGKKPTQKK